MIVSKKVMNYYLKEACVESYDEAIEAAACGADRIELCSRLDLDGLTPDKSLIKLLQQTLEIPIKVMIRPREGDFNYSNSEISEMELAIELCKSIGVFGVVFGLLNSNKELDIENTAKLSKLSYPMNVCFHKAIDETNDIIKACKDLCKIPEVDAILTSGKALTAYKGKDVLKEMIQISENKLTIIPAGKNIMAEK